jgi:hypothetical protein
VTLDDLEYAREKILMGPERLSAVISEEAKKITIARCSYHVETRIIGGEEDYDCEVFIPRRNTNNRRRAKTI